MPNEETPEHRAMDVLVKLGLIAASPQLQSKHLLALRDVLVKNVPVDALAAMQKQVTGIGKAHVQAAIEGLTPVAGIKPGENQNR